MKASLLFLALLICLATSMQAEIKGHILRHLETDIQKMKAAYEQHDTSLAFSIAMKIYTSVDILMKETDIPAYTQEQILTSGESDCKSLLKEVLTLSSGSNWVENYQKTQSIMKKLHASCTNSDFSYGSETALKGGFQNKCAGCVVITRIIQNYIDYHNENITQFINKKFCSLFDGALKPTCQTFVNAAGKPFIEAVINKQTADVVCLGLGMCDNPECRIIKEKKERLLFEIKPDSTPAPWEWLIHIFVDKFGDGHLPPFDLDGDAFSEISTFRGHHWRGKDCNELSPNMYPGREKGNKVLDQDCNGIYGIGFNGKTYQQQFCSESKRFGVAVLGDSAGAHFSIPEKYFNVSMFTRTSWHDILLRAADELDIPHESAYTAHTKTEGYVRHSFYKFAREWNLCNHNDYQNIAVNGGDSKNSQQNNKALRRKHGTDYPLIMFLELIGNDVCQKSIERMTTVEHFKENVLKMLNYLDHTVPKGSHLMLLGLADGELLYDNLHDAIHPLNVTYEKVYDFLNCLQISPCWSWLNTNETIRKYTTERAQNLSKVYKEIIEQGTTFENFDMVYYDFPAMEILERKMIEGGDPKDMIERCDGFHPNGEFHSDLGDWLWNKVKTSHPDWIGARNPHNAKIREIFGHEVYN